MIIYRIGCSNSIKRTDFTESNRFEYAFPIMVLLTSSKQLI
jgi:hypothetical protein